MSQKFDIFDFNNVKCNMECDGSHIMCDENEFYLAQEEYLSRVKHNSLYYNDLLDDRKEIALEQIFYDVGRDFSIYLSVSERGFLKMVLEEVKPTHRFWRSAMDDCVELSNFDLHFMGYIGNRLARLSEDNYYDYFSRIGFHELAPEEDMFIYICRYCGFRNNFLINCRHVNEIGAESKIINFRPRRVISAPIEHLDYVDEDEYQFKEPRRQRKILPPKEKKVRAKLRDKGKKFRFSYLSDRCDEFQIFDILSPTAERKISNTIDSLNDTLGSINGVAKSINSKMEALTPLLANAVTSVETAANSVDRAVVETRTEIVSIKDKFEEFKDMISTSLKPNILSMASAFIADLFWIVVGEDWKEEMIKFIVRYILIFNVPGVLGNKVIELVKDFTSTVESQSMESLYKLILPIISMLFFDRITKGEWIAKRINELGSRGRDLNNIKLGTNALKEYAESFYKTISDLMYDLCGENLPEFLCFDKELAIRRRAQKVMKEAVEVVAAARLEVNKADPIFRNRIKIVISDIDDLIIRACAGELPLPIQRNLWTLRREVEPIYKKITFCMEQKTARTDPMCVYFGGPSGIGKSGATPRLISKLVAQAEYDFSQPVVYTRPPGAKYETNYVNQPILCIDDGFMSKKAKDEAFFMAAKSVAPFAVEQADLPDKGQQFTSDIILINSNFDYPTPEESKHDPALQRRRDILWHVEKTNVPMKPDDIHAKHLRYVRLDPSNKNDLSSKREADYVDFEKMCEITLQEFDNYMKNQCILLANYPDNIGGIVLPMYKKAKYYYECKQQLEITNSNLNETSLAPEICVQMLSGITHGIGCVCNDDEFTLAEDCLVIDDIEKIYDGGSRHGIPFSLIAHKHSIMDEKANFRTVPEAFLFAYNHYLLLTDEEKIAWTRAASEAWIVNPRVFNQSLEDYGLDICSRFRRWYRDNISSHQGREFAVHCVLAGGLALTTVSVGMLVRNMLKPERTTLDSEEHVFDSRIKKFVAQLDDGKCEKQSNEIRTKYARLNRFVSEGDNMVKAFDVGLAKFRSESNEVKTKYSKLNRFVSESANVDTEGVAFVKGLLFYIMKEAQRDEKFKSVCMEGVNIEPLSVSDLNGVVNTTEIGFALNCPEVLERDKRLLPFYAYYDDWSEDTRRGPLELLKHMNKYLSTRPNEEVGAKVVDENGLSYYYPVPSRFEDGKEDLGLISESLDPNMLQIENLIRNNVYEIRYEGQRLCQGLVVCENFMLVNYHFVRFVGSNPVSLIRDGITFNTFIRDCDIFKFPVLCSDGKQRWKDVVLWRVGGKISPIPNHRDIRRHFVVDDDLCQLFSCPLVLLNYDGKEFRTRESVRHLLASSMTITDDYAVVQCVKYAVITGKGFCGTPALICNVKVPRKILSIHAAGRTGSNMGAGEIVTQDMLNSAFEFMSGRVQSELSGREALPEFEPITEENCDRLKLFPSEDVCVLGFSPVPIFQPRDTDIIPSVIFESITPHTTEPSVLTPSDDRLDPAADSPLQQGVEKEGHPMCALDINLLEEILQYKIDRDRSLLFDSGVPRLLTPFEVLNGVHTLQKMNFSTSDGFPLAYIKNPKTPFPKKRGKKKWFYQIDDVWKMYEDTTFTQKLIEAEDSLRKGFIPLWFSYVYCLKDERRSLEKVRSGKTRVFAMSGTVETYLYRKYMGGFIAALLQNKRSKQGFGTNATGTDWTELYQYFMEVSSLDNCDEFEAWCKSTNNEKFLKEKFLMLAFDYRAYDAKTRPVFMRMFCERANAWYRHRDKDWDRRDDIVRTLLTESAMFKYCRVLDIIIYVCLGMSSGFGGTTPSNSDTGENYIMYAWLKITRSNKKYSAYATLAEYDKYIRDIYYGDDVAASVSRVVANFFNGKTVSNVLRVDMELDVTSALKSETIEDFYTMDETTFLKRGFVLHPLYRDVVLAPIDKNTIYEMINWIRKSGNPLDLTISNCRDALREAYHHGFEFFDDLKKKLEKAFEELQHPVRFDNYATEDSRFLSQFDKLG